MKCTAKITPLGERRMRECGQLASHALEDGTGRCPRHHKGRGTKIQTADLTQAQTDVLVKGMAEARAKAWSESDEKVADLEAKLVIARMAEDLARSLAMEEAARRLECFKNLDTGKTNAIYQDAADTVRTLATLDPSLVAVEKEAIRWTIHWVELLLGEAANGTTSAYSKEKVRDELAKLRELAK